ncbi:MAG: hypothetical protein ACOCWQ_00335 [Nanoarchaeota archaeon]
MSTKDILVGVQKILDTIEKQIDMLETYIKMREMELAEETEKLVLSTLDETCTILGYIRHPEYMKILVTKEITILEKIERIIQDMISHPNHIASDDEILKLLENFLQRIESMELKLLRSKHKKEAA